MSVVAWLDFVKYCVLYSYFYTRLHLFICCAVDSSVPEIFDKFNQLFVICYSSCSLWRRRAGEFIHGQNWYIAPSSVVAANPDAVDAADNALCKWLLHHLLQDNAQGCWHKVAGSQGSAPWEYQRTRSHWKEDGLVIWEVSNAESFVVYIYIISISFIYKIDAALGQLALVFEHISLEDKGNWTCEMDSSAAREPRKSFELLVNRKLCWIKQSVR